MIRQQMLRRKREISFEIRRLEARLSDAPEGSLITATCRGKVQYYHKTETGKKSGVYIPSDNIQLVRELAQKEYDRKTLKLLKHESLLIEKFIDNSKEEEIQNVYWNMHPDKRPFVTVIEADDDTYAANWLKTKPLGSDDYMPEKRYFPTDSGINVRSKAEQTIADMLFKNGIPFKYEVKVETMCNMILYPDFLILNKRTRKEYYLEYLGLMEDQNYRTKLYNKLYAYSTAGIVEGNNLMLLFGIPVQGVETEILERMITDVFQ